MVTGEQFIRDIVDFTDNAANAIKLHPANDVNPIAMQVRDILGQSKSESLVSTFSTYADDLIDARSGDGLWAAAEGGLVPQGLLKSRDRNGVYIELLTTTWLGLYYLGVPDGRPWDAVRRWADEHGGGLPNGACLAKAIGDVVRGAMRAHNACRRGGSCVPAGDLLVHSYLPMIIFPELIDKPVSRDPSSDDPALPAQLHRLGRRYEYIQLILYANAGFPFLYSVPKRFVETYIIAEWEKKRPRDQKVTKYCVFEAICSELRSRLQHAVTPDDAAHQRVVVVDYDRPPACFLNDDTGLFTFEEIDAQDKIQDIPLPASYMLPERRQLYRRRSTKSERNASPNLLSTDIECRNGIFRKIFPKEPLE